MKNEFFERIKDRLYGLLPLLCLIGIPLIMCIAPVLIFCWDDFLVLIDKVSDLGNGSLLYGCFILFLLLIGFINFLGAFLLWSKYVLEKLKTRSCLVFWSVIIICTLGCSAFFKLLLSL